MLAGRACNNKRLRDAIGGKREAESRLRNEGRVSDPYGRIRPWNPT
jgi:hypothetical protein